MRKLISFVILLLAFPLFTGGVFEIEGLKGFPNLPLAIALSLGAQAVVLAAGFVASPSVGRGGAARAIALTFYSLEALKLPLGLSALLYQQFAHVELLDSTMLTWILLVGSSGLAFLLFLRKPWHFSFGARV